MDFSSQPGRRLHRPQVRGHGLTLRPGLQGL